MKAALMENSILSLRLTNLSENWMSINSFFNFNTRIWSCSHPLPKHGMNKSWNIFLQHFTKSFCDLQAMISRSRNTSGKNLFKINNFSFLLSIPGCRRKKSFSPCPQKKQAAKQKTTNNKSKNHTREMENSLQFLEFASTRFANHTISKISF